MRIGKKKMIIILTIIVLCVISLRFIIGKPISKSALINQTGMSDIFNDMTRISQYKHAGETSISVEFLLDYQLQSLPWLNNYIDIESLEDTPYKRHIQELMAQYQLSGENVKVSSFIFSYKKLFLSYPVEVIVLSTDNTNSTIQVTFCFNIPDRILVL